MKISRVAQGLFAALVATAAVGAAPATSLAAPATGDQFSTAAVGNTLVYKQKTEGYDCFRIPAVVKANNGELLAFAEGRNGGASFCNDRGDIDLVVKRSADNGKTWSAPKVVIEGFGDTKGNPTPIVIPSTGRIVLLSVMECVKNPDCNRIPRVSISDDHGKTWTAPKVLTTQLGFSSAPGWLATGPSHGIVLTRGAHAGRIVAGMSYTVDGKNSGALIYSDDQGVTWKRGATDTPAASVELNPQEISVTELLDGRVYAAARNQANNDDKCLSGGAKNRAYAISSDGGASFSTKFTFEEDLITPVVQASTARMTATDKAGKYNRILFAAPSVCDRRKELVVRSSFDEGANWQGNSAGTLVWSGDAAYSDMVQLSSGSVGVLYEAGPAGNANETIRFSTVTETTLGAPVCGGGYGVIDSAPLGTAGTVYLSYNASNGQNCVSTMKSESAGTATATSAYLEVAGASRITDSGSFSWFAGPVRAAAAGKCVKWGGSAGGTAYNSPSEHCG
ncbi:exo-alpha-sialidase [Amycolatopsis sp. WAC 04182]|uniref:sialidase family protein n=1 Tax=Amycolatopsis sp. WAC 04182 TaxID=2203198 RepID=UPI000F7AB552|nr:sialidase family protein [Amycolatopsis sp. WAC 04182]RSN63638.1 exo-alpha-sialidase [Amycolatopsis sp. WAC 04182]